MKNNGGFFIIMMLGFALMVASILATGEKAEQQPERRNNINMTKGPNDN